MRIKKVLRGVGVAFLATTLFLLSAACIAVAAAGIWAARHVDATWDDTLYAIATTDRTTRLFASDAAGEWQEWESERLSGGENALFCPISEMSPDLVNAFIAIEDKRFFSHGGVDWARTANAALTLVRTGKADFGGSTITQQLVKNLTGDSERSVTRKLTEMMRAAKLEKDLSKKEILEQYLNVVNLSRGCYGVRTAANTYFSKEPRDLTLAEAASIAAITNNPARYDPVRHPQANRTRRNVILSEMLAQGMIDETAYRAAAESDVELRLSEAENEGNVNDWYTDLVISDVIRDLVESRGMSEGEAARLVYAGGLKIYLCVDRGLQETVAAYYRDPDHFPVHEGGKRAQSALLIVDPASGALLAVAGAVGEKTSNRVQNFATDARRPSGSVIKPLAVYAPAFRAGLVNWATVFDDVPLTFRDNGAPWPRNSPNLYRGLTTINEAITYSVNTVSVSVFERVGAAASYRFLTEELGFTSLDPEKDRNAIALALGQQVNGVTLREVVGGYTALANGGVYTGTRTYEQVLDSKGNVLLAGKTAARRVLDESDAAILTMLLRNVTETGTGKAVTLKDTVDVAGKTGTSSNNADKWFVGYTPELLAGVWYGFEYPESVADVGKNPALSAFDAVMRRAIAARGVEKRQFETPADVVAARYCKDSGGVLTEACTHDPRGDRAEIGYFKAGTEPTFPCDRHVEVAYCTHGGVAGAYCPAETCETVSLVRVSRSFPRQIYVRDAAYSYTMPPAKKEQILSENEPYYAENYETKQYFGIGIEEIPYNHYCTAHTGDPFWDRRLR